MKHMMILAVLLIAFSSCKKSGNETSEITVYVTDFDSHAPIQGAKVFVEEVQNGNSPLTIIIDSTLTDANGKAILALSSGVKYLYTVKEGYLIPFSGFSILFPENGNQTVNHFLARPSYVKINLHKANSYLSTDTLELGASSETTNTVQPFDPMNRIRKGINNFLRKADMPDTSITAPVVYYSPPANKIWIYWRVYSDWNQYFYYNSKSDSAELVQFGTKTYNLNY